MPSVMNKLAAKVTKDVDRYGTAFETCMYPTSQKLMDHMNGYYHNVKKIYQTGISYGRILGIVGKTGAGKTTLALKIADDLASQFEESQVYFYDYERTSDLTRLMAITGRGEDEISWGDQEITDKTKWITKQANIYTETVYDTIQDIAAFKTEYKKELLVNDAFGQKVLPPTIIVVDSLMTMLGKPDPKAKVELKAGMSVTQRAKTNAEFFRGIAGLCFENNIIFIYINHIMDMITTGTPVAAKINNLKIGESLPGGNTPQYLATNILKVIPSTKIKPEEGYKIDGFMIKASFLKSKSAASGTEFVMVLDKNNGYDNDITMLEFLKANKLVGGSGKGTYIQGLETVKFSLGTFKEKLKTVPEFREYFDALCDKQLKNLIRIPTNFATIAEVSEDIGGEDIEQEFAISDESVLESIEEMGAAE